MDKEREAVINGRMWIWSMRPQPRTPEGIAWEQGCRQGYEWGLADAELQTHPTPTDKDDGWKGISELNIYRHFVREYLKAPNMVRRMMLDDASMDVDAFLAATLPQPPQAESK